MKTLLENRQARHNFFITDTMLAGLKLEGWEVKSIRAGRANFNGGGAFVRFDSNGEAWLDAMTITPLKESSMGLLAPRNPARARKLLMKRSELAKLASKVAQRGMTVVPLAVVDGHHFKLQIGLAKGKKLHDKRETTKERDMARSAAREMAC
jgi:SsrA-binding protein